MIKTHTINKLIKYNTHGTIVSERCAVSWRSCTLKIVLRSDPPARTSALSFSDDPNGWSPTDGCKIVHHVGLDKPRSKRLRDSMKIFTQQPRITRERGKLAKFSKRELCLIFIKSAILGEDSRERQA